MLSRTDRLRSEFEHAFAERPFAVRFWDGSEIPATRDGAPTFFVRSPKACAHVLRAPGELGLDRAYVQGLVDVDDLDAAVRLVDSWRPPEPSLRQQARLAAGLARACGLTRPPRRPVTELRLRGARHTLSRDRRAVRYHYDAGNEFFALFLDDSMTYSCAFWNTGATTLEEAQQAKLELVCKKLALEPGTRVLDVGCGWGSFARHAARDHGARVLGITLSEPQVAYARERARREGLDDRVEFRVGDYRELEAEPFDAICSIGMVEHVGEAQIDTYARHLARLLRPGGRLLNHGIAQLRHEDTDEDYAGPVSDRYIFPDGEPLHLSRIQLALERAGLATEHVEGFFDDYPKTITQWLERYERRYDDAIRIAGSERARIWRLYLHAARVGFEGGLEAVYQVRCTKR
jgi:cyclopropane-fatty-acyl-phospholipid synthase